MICISYKLASAPLALFASHVECQSARLPVVRQLQGLGEKHAIHNRLKELVQSTAKGVE